LLGAPRQPASLARIGGVGLVVLGVVVLGLTRNTQPVE
jgi:hypothetical protein